MFLRKIKTPIFIALCLTSILCHKCGKSPIPEIETMHFESQNSFLDEQNRKLQSSTPIRITFDDTLIRTEDKKQYLYSIKHAMETAINFNQQFTKVKIPVSQEYKMNRCGSRVPFTDEMKDKVIKNSDMHFYLMASQDDENDWLARAAPCYTQPIDKRPIVGLVEFNTRFTQDNLSSFQMQDLVETTIHEMFHALAFSSVLFPLFDNVDKTKFLVDQSGKSWIAFPNVLNFVQNHFGCKEITKIFLEDDGGPGSASSHWERTLFQNDMMTASEVPGSNTWSGLNNALMQDSGWYDVDLNFHDRLFWGKNKGCDFYNLKCKANPRPEEFCDATNTQAPRIDYHFSGLSFCVSMQQDIFLDDDCSYFATYDNMVCTNLDNNKQESGKNYTLAGSAFGWESKGVQSSLQPEGKVYLKENKYTQCYPSKCVENAGKKNIEFYVGEKQQKLVCEKDKQVLKLNGYSGELTCPIISNFCERQYTCENFCNSGGFCMNQKCYCNPGFSGPNCECGNGVFYKNKSCTNCTTPNCYSCNDSNKCVKCNDNFTLDSFGQCIQNQVKPKCTQTNCFSCDDTNKCIKCYDNYEIQESGQCFRPETKCTDLNCGYCIDANKCLKCKLNFSLNTSGQCICSDPNCQQCSDTNKCTQCKNNFTQDTSGQCSLKCTDTNCLQCNGINNCTKCKLNFSPNTSGQCICSDPNCLQCSDTNKCTQCKDNFTQDTSGQCSLKCTDTNCLQCNDINNCTKCSENYTVQSGKCVTKSENQQSIVEVSSGPVLFFNLLIILIHLL